MSDRIPTEDRDLETVPDGLEPPQACTTDGWEPIEGAPDWLNRKDRRDHANARLILGELTSLTGRVTTIEGRVHHHDQRLAQVEAENRELRRENEQLRRELQQHIDKTKDDDDR